MYGYRVYVTAFVYVKTYGLCVDGLCTMLAYHYVHT